MTQEELIMAMYRSKKKETYTDDRAQKNLDTFHSLCEKWVESHPGEILSQEEINKLRLQTTGDDGSKGIYGQGSLYRKTDNVLNPAALQAPNPIENPPVITSPHPLERLQPRFPTPTTPPSIGNLHPQVVQHRSPTPPQPYYPSPPSPSRNEGEYYKIAYQQQQQILQQLLSQMPQGGMQRMDTSRSHPNPSTMQTNMPFQQLMNTGALNVDGVGPSSATGSYFPNFYGNE